MARRIPFSMGSIVRSREMSPFTPLTIGRLVSLIPSRSITTAYSCLRFRFVTWEQTTGTWQEGHSVPATSRLQRGQL